ncbi:MAG: cell division protein FtsA [Bacteroidales bacterium]|nr:cell division protein FtsA [Bacteroidales bacterium]
MNKYIVGLDIGTTKIACFIGERSQNGKIRILGFGKTESVGVERGVVRNIRDTSESIRRAVAEASEMAKYDVEEVYVGIAGQHIKSRSNTGSVMIPDEHRQIEKSDVDRLIDDQYRVMLEPGEEIIHVFPQSFTVDNDKLEPEINPVGVAGKCLMANFHIVTGNAANVRNIRDAVEEAGLKIKGVVLEPIASAYAVLDERDKNAGVALVDIGGGTTDIAIFQDGIIRHTSVLPLAGNVITNDIRESCKILKHQAESLKTKFGSCVPNLVNQDDIIAIPGIRNQPPREISVKTLAGIIKARMQLLLEQVQYEIQLSGFERQLIAGVVLTGGGARLKNIKEFSEVTIGIDSRIGTPDEHLDQQGSITFEDLGHPMYATGIGLVIYGLLEAEQEQRNAMDEKTAQESVSVAEAQPAHEAEEEEVEVEEKNKEKTKKKKKIAKDENRKGFADSIKDWLTDKFTEPDLGE